MKNATVSTFLALVLLFTLANGLSAESKDDIQAIKKAVKENPNYEAGTDVKWFKILVTDTQTKKDKVRITMPISLVEILARVSENKHMRINREEYNIDLKELFSELKKLGPMALIEIFEEDETVKIWLE